MKAFFFLIFGLLLTVSIASAQLYDLSGIQNATTVTEVFRQTDAATGGTLISGFFVAMFFVFIMALRKYPLEDTIPAVSFVFFILSILLRHAGLIGFYPLTFFLLILGISSVYKFLSSS